MFVEGPEGVQHIRMHQSFEDHELVYSALKAAELFTKHRDPDNGILKLLARAIQHKNNELRVTYDDQVKGWKQNPG